MKKSNLLKAIVVLGLSLILVVNFISVAKADDFSGWDDPTTTQTNTTNTLNTTNTTSNITDITSNTSDITSTSTTTSNTTNTLTTNSNSTGNTSNSTLSTGSAVTTLNTSSSETESNDVNTLAYTGIESNTPIIVIILVGAIVAGYSLKKVREYNI